MAAGNLVLVTGGSGFIAVHCILQLLQRNYRVRTTLRSLKRQDEVRSMLVAGGATEEQAKSVQFAIADLTSDKGWTEACQDCAYVLHVASPFPAGVPKHPDELVIPAREGALRALRAAKTAGTVRRVVLTSSFNAISDGRPPTDNLLTESDWTNLDDPKVAAYPRSKTTAEKAAWDWMKQEGGEMELSVVNPVAVFGPTLGKDYGTSLELIARLMNGQLPGCPHLNFSIVDVRDVADLHIRAMTDPKATGERFIAVCDDPTFSVKQISESLKRQLGSKAKKVPTRELPDVAVRFIALFDGAVGMIVPQLSKKKETTNAKAKEMLGWSPRGADEAINASAESLERFGLLK